MNETLRKSIRNNFLNLFTLSCYSKYQVEDLSSRNKDMQQIPTWSKKKSTNSGIKISIPKLHCGIQNGFEKMKELIKERINQHMLEKSSDSRNHQLENRNDRNQRKIMTGMK